MTHYSRQQRSSHEMGMTDWLSNSVRERPEAFLLMAAGVALMMTNTRVGLSDLWSSNRRSASMGSRRSQFASSSSTPSMTSRVGESIDELREAAGDYTQRARDYVSETTENLTQQSSEMIEKARSSVQDNISRMLDEQPLVLGAIGLAAGAVLGAMLPETEMENRTLGSARDELAATAKTMAQDKVEALKSMAGDVMSSGSSSQQQGSQTSSQQRDPGSSNDEKSNTARSTTRSSS